MIRKHTRRAAKAAFAISLGVAIVIGLFAAAFARPAQSAGTTVVLGTKNFAEEYILGQLYKQALEAKGFKVTYKENIGSTEIIQTALTSGKINMYPEYTGVIVQVVFHHALSAEDGCGDVCSSPSQLEATKGYHGAQPDPVLRHRRGCGHECDGEEVRPEDDLRPEEGPGTSSSAASRSARRATPASSGYTKHYGLEERDVRAARRHLAVRRARRGQGAGRRRVLDRPAARQGLEVHGARRPEARDGFQNVAPIVKTSVATALGPKFTQTVNAVSATLTLHAIIAMNKA